MGIAGVFFKERVRAARVICGFGAPPYEFLYEKRLRNGSNKRALGGRRKLRSLGLGAPRDARPPRADATPSLAANGTKPHSALAESAAKEVSVEELVKFWADGYLVLLGFLTPARTPSGRLTCIVTSLPGAAAGAVGVGAP